MIYFFETYDPRHTVYHIPHSNSLDTVPWAKSLNLMEARNQGNISGKKGLDMDYIMACFQPRITSSNLNLKKELLSPFRLFGKSICCIIWHHINQLLYKSMTATWKLNRFTSFRNAVACISTLILFTIPTLR